MMGNAGASYVFILVQRDQALVFVVASDPEPMKNIMLEQSQCPMSAADTDRPDRPGFLELKGWVTGIVNPQPVGLSGSGLDFRR
jgi:hypothetical protein